MAVLFAWQTDRAKGGRETCSGLDEAGNDLGDISLGFFLRQVCVVLVVFNGRVCGSCFV